MNNTNSCRPSVSTWALRKTLGATFPDRPGDPSGFSVSRQGDGSLALLDVPEKLAARGIHTLELCHFHLPSREASYLTEVRARLDAAKVELWSLLLDDGDITHPETHRRDTDWIFARLETAAALGAKNIRVIAGKQPPSAESNRLSRDSFRKIAARAESLNIGVLTENWFAFLPAPENIHALLDDLDGAVRLNLDFGNWDDHGASKYDDLLQIAPGAVGCHAKARFLTADTLDETDWKRCLEITRAANYRGPLTLVDGGPGDEWNGIGLQQRILQPYLAESPTA